MAECKLDAVEDLPVTDDLPSTQMLAEAADIEVLDHKGQPHLFRSVYDGEEVSSRVVVVFIRHFFCGACQSYTELLSSTATPALLSTLPVSTTFVIVGNGEPALINEYAEKTKCRFPIFTDPTGRLFDMLEMAKTTAVGARTRYSPDRWLWHFVNGLWNIVTQFSKLLLAGNPMRVGGEFVFEPGQAGKVVTWCHRMRNHRDHTEVDELFAVLGIPTPGDDGPSE
ncbi:Thioredoxin-like protein AAED1 [Colletotrichum siamense]|nr:Thioredoxin-like protein AAED1 [Colletotrichum siamense]